ncbi:MULTISPECIES: histidine phosphatase family protein [Paenibacillus]|uniref:histidine phosphatase family protein n=1 Tax=Paenibacillus TaxID=44249 RepID=UPI0003E21EAE|nr:MULTISPECIES: histidine phosphatase family protein [Paenibacillus]ETT58494.1 phosphoglycerate mutase [Paenibacillus sp. FSL H8-237]
MQIFLIRHGDPDYSIDNLTEFGHQEAAAALGKRMASIGLVELYASPLGYELSPKGING